MASAQDLYNFAHYDVPQEIQNLWTDIDHFWTALTGAVVLIMQLGFAFLEGGCVRYNNMQSIMIKVFNNTCVAIIMMWIVGYGLMFGSTNGTRFNGTNFFGAFAFKQGGSADYADFVFNTSLAAAANSIVSGGAAERMSFMGYILLSVLFSGWIYPVVIHWAYGPGGWLNNMGYHDFAGSGAIHLTSGIGALVVTYMLKPRKNRFDPKHENEFKPSNPTYICLATLTLYMAWTCFNSGSTLALSNNAIYTVSNSIANTMIGGASGALTVFFYHWVTNRNTNSMYSLVMLCNGNLAGLVAVTGSNDEIENWAAFVIGIMGGIMYVIVAKILHRLEIDDPVDAVPIHAGCGLVGAMCPGWFSHGRGIYYGFGAYQWGVQILGCLCFVCWSFGWHVLGVTILKKLKLYNVDDGVTEKGFDPTLCGGPAFYFEPIRDQEMMQPEVRNANFSQIQSHHVQQQQ